MSWDIDRAVAIYTLIESTGRILQRSKTGRPRSSEYWSAKLRISRISPVAVCAVTVNRRLSERLTSIQM